MTYYSINTLARNWMDLLTRIFDYVFYAPMQNTEPCRIQCNNKQNDERMRRLSIAGHSFLGSELQPDSLNIQLTKKLEDVIVRKREELEEMAKDSNKKYPKWKKTAIKTARSIYNVYSSRSENGLLSFDQFMAICTRFEVNIDEEEAKKKFWTTSRAKDGFLTEEEFLNLVYNFGPTDEGSQLNNLSQKFLKYTEDEEEISNMDPEIRFMLGLT